MGPVWQNPIQRTVRTSHLSNSNCVVCSYIVVHYAPCTLVYTTHHVHYCTLRSMCTGVHYTPRTLLYTTQHVQHTQQCCIMLLIYHTLSFLSSHSVSSLWWCVPCAQWCSNFVAYLEPSEARISCFTERSTRAVMEWRPVYMTNMNLCKVGCRKSLLVISKN